MRVWFRLLSVVLLLGILCSIALGVIKWWEEPPDSPFEEELFEPLRESPPPLTIIDILGPWAVYAAMTDCSTGTPTLFLSWCLRDTGAYTRSEYHEVLTEVDSHAQQLATIVVTTDDAYTIGELFPSGQRSIIDACSLTEAFKVGCGAELKSMWHDVTTGYHEQLASAANVTTKLDNNKVNKWTTNEDVDILCLDEATGTVSCGAATFKTQAYVFQCNDPAGLDATQYMQASAIGSACTATDTISTNAVYPVPIAGVITNLNCEIGTTPTSGTTFTYTIRVQSVDSAIECSISNGSTTCSDTGTIAIAANQRFSIAADESAGAGIDASAAKCWTRIVFD